MAEIRSLDEVVGEIFNELVLLRDSGGASSQELESVIEKCRSLLDSLDAHDIDIS